MVKIKKADHTSVSKGVEQLEYSYTNGGNVTGYHHLEKLSGGLLKS